MTLRRILPGFLVGAGLLALACWWLALALLWIRVPLILPAPSDPWVLQAGLAAALLAVVALAVGVWLIGRAGRVSRATSVEGDITDEQEGIG